MRGLAERALRHGVALSSHQVGSMFTGFFRAEPVRDYADAKTCDLQAFARYHRAMLSAGVYLAPSQFEAAFVSIAHDPATIERTLDAADGAFAAVRHPAE